MLRLPLCLAIFFVGCDQADPKVLTTDELLLLGWEILPPGPTAESYEYSIKVAAQDINVELHGSSYVESLLSPEGVSVPRIYEEWQCMNARACPGPSLRATVNIRQPVVDGVRQERVSTVEVDVWYSPHQSDEVRSSYVLQVDLSRSQVVTRDGITVTLARRPK